MTPLSLHELIQEPPGQSRWIELLIKHHTNAGHDTVDSRRLNADRLTAGQHQVRLHVLQESQHNARPQIFNQIIYVVSSCHPFTGDDTIEQILRTQGLFVPKQLRNPYCRSVRCGANKLHDIDLNSIRVTETVFQTTISTKNTIQTKTSTVRFRNHPWGGFAIINMTLEFNNLAVPDSFSTVSKVLVKLPEISY